MPVPLEEMDKFAEQAAAELRENWHRWSAHAVAVWWEKWYRDAGHRRLGRALVSIANPLDPRLIVDPDELDEPSGPDDLEDSN